MEIEKLIDRYFFALERKVIREIYNKHTREELEKFIFKCNSESCCTFGYETLYSPGK